MMGQHSNNSSAALTSATVSILTGASITSSVVGSTWEQDTLPAARGYHTVVLGEI